MEKKPCKYCGKLFEPDRKNGVFCSIKCRVSSHRLKGREHTVDKIISEHPYADMIEKLRHFHPGIEIMVAHFVTQHGSPAAKELIKLVTEIMQVAAPALPALKRENKVMKDKLEQIEQIIQSKLPTHETQPVELAKSKVRLDRAFAWDMFRDRAVDIEGGYNAWQAKFKLSEQEIWQEELRESFDREWARDAEGLMTSLLEHTRTRSSDRK